MGFTEQELRALAKKQLGLEDDVADEVPVAYLFELGKHVTLYPQDINFSVELQEGRGYGVVTCLEKGCNRVSMDLCHRVSAEDGGFSDGFGSLSTYRVHITSYPQHIASRVARVNGDEFVKVEVEPFSISFTLNTPTSNQIRPSRPIRVEPQDCSFSTPTHTPGASPVRTQARERIIPRSQPSTSAMISSPRKRPSSSFSKAPASAVRVKDEEPESIDLSSIITPPLKRIKTEFGFQPSTPTKKPLSQANRTSPWGKLPPSTPQSITAERASLNDLQRNISDLNYQISRITRKSTSLSKPEIARVMALQREKAEQEKEAASLSARFTTVSRTGSWAFIKKEVEPYASPFANSNMWSRKKEPISSDDDNVLMGLPDSSSPARRTMYRDQTPVASGSDVVLPPSSLPATSTSPARSTSPFDRKPILSPLAVRGKAELDVKPRIAHLQLQAVAGTSFHRAPVKPEPEPLSPSAKERLLFGLPNGTGQEGQDPFFNGANLFVDGQLPIAPADDDLYDQDGNWCGRGRDRFVGPQANANDIDKFLIAAGNAEQFDGNARVEDALERLGLPGLYQPLPGMEVALMPHQAIGVAWMLDREKGPHKGGCLSDEMGLGKTVQMLATVVSNRPQSPTQKLTLIVAPLALLDQWQMEIELKTNCGLKCLIYHGASKAKCPADLLNYDIVLTTFHTLSNEWPDPEEQFKKEKKKKRAKKHTIVAENSDEEVVEKKKLKKKELGLLLRTEWYRVILDEAQNIRNKRTRISRAVTKLESLYRWALTGTPIINGLADAYALLRFLQIRPWYDWDEFNRHVARPEKKHPTLATTRLQAIFKQMLLRRMKDSLLDGKRLIELPSKEVHLTKLEFTAEERDVYQMVEAQSQATFNKFLRAGTVLKNYHQVLVMLLRLRQICSHPSLIQESGDAFILPVDETDAHVSFEAREELERARNEVSPDFVVRMKYKLREVALQRMAAEQQSADATVDDEECPICFDTMTAAIITPCTHIFCRECIINALSIPRVDDVNDQQQYKANERPCPACRSAISKEKLYARSAFLPTDEELEAATEAQGDGSSSAPIEVDSDVEMVDAEAADSTRPSRNGKGKGPRKARARRAYDSEDDSEHEEADDNLSDFIVHSDEDEEEKEERRKLKKRLGKMKQRAIILDSDDESEGERVVFGKKTPALEDLSPEKVKLMPKFLPSTKMKHMMELLSDWAEKHPDEKTLVVSQWTQCLQLVSDYLTERGVLHVKYQGDMSRSKRDKAVRAFMGKDKAQVMLMSLKCGGVGLNLTRANRVISLDLAWSAAIESQAFDRVHRLGQMRDVVVHRLVIENTIEDRVLALQQRKQHLADGCLGEGSGKKIGRLSVRELANLFGLDHRGHLLEN